MPANFKCDFPESLASFLDDLRRKMTSATRRDASFERGPDRQKTNLDNFNIKKEMNEIKMAII